MWVGLKSNGWCLYKMHREEKIWTHRREREVKAEAETGVVQPQGKPAATRSCKG